MPKVARHTYDTALAYKQTWTTVFTSAISFIFTLFGATLILPCDLVRHFPALRFGPSVSMSVIFTPCFSLVLMFQVLHFQSPHFEARIIRRTIKCDHRRRACRTIAFKTKKRMKIWRMTRVKSYVYESLRENLRIKFSQKFWAREEI